MIIIMEKIRNNLEENEEILWSTESTINLLFIIVTGIPLMIGSIFILLFLIPNLFQIDYYFKSDYIFFGILRLVVLLVGIMAIIYIFYQTHIFKKRGKLTWGEVLKYKEIAVLTNKRWIQKERRISRLKHRDKVEDKLELQGDIVFVDLKQIQAIKIIEMKKRAYVNLYFDYSKITPKSLFLGVETKTRQSFDNLIAKIKSMFSIKRVEQIPSGKDRKEFIFYL